MIPQTRKAWLRQFDEPGHLSILVHGGVFENALVQLANHCEHWRQLFPAAQIVLSISVTDVLIGHCAENGVMSRLRLIPKLRHNGILAAALRAIVGACDTIVLSGGAVPLPPIKDAPNINNANLQIAAVRAGLPHVGGHHLLRVRSDLVLTDRRFLTYYSDATRHARGKSTLLRERVLISQLFTLNPYTVERLPFHFSDWFHFGLTSDVRRLWDVRPIPFADAIHYRLHPHVEHSNALERLFYTRRGVEQHLTVESLGKLSPHIHLDYHNQVDMADLSMRVLIDNYVVADMRGCGVYLEKYLWNYDHVEIPLVTVTPEEWTFLAATGEKDFEGYFAQKIRDARRKR